MHSQSHELVALRHAVTRHAVTSPAPALAPSVPTRRRNAIAIAHTLVAAVVAALARLA